MIADAVNRAQKEQMREDFGRLTPALLKYIRITGERHPAPPQTSIIISCADHGVAAESVSAYPPETTQNMMRNYLIAVRRQMQQQTTQTPHSSSPISA